MYILYRRTTLHINRRDRHLQECLKNVNWSHMHGLMMNVGSRNVVFTGMSVVSNELIMTPIMLSGWWHFAQYTNWGILSAANSCVVTSRSRSSFREAIRVRCADRLIKCLVVWSHRHHTTEKSTSTHLRHFLKVDLFLIYWFIYTNAWV